MVNFKTFLISEEFIDAKSDLAQHLVDSKVDLDGFNKSLHIIQEAWGFNPFATFGKSAGAGAGAVLGSAFGPLGTALGGMAGGALGSLGNWLTGRSMKGARVVPLQGAYKQAVQAVDSLSQMLSQQDVQSSRDAEVVKQNVGELQSNLKNLGPKISQIDQERNQNLDSKLQSGGGIGSRLRGADSSTSLGKIQNWIGNKIKDIPALNQDMGLRRAFAQGMDAVQKWADENPKKAALLNIGAGVAGGLTGAMGAGSLRSTGQSSSEESPDDTQQNKPERVTRRARNSSSFGFDSDKAVRVGDVDHERLGDAMRRAGLSTNNITVSGVPHGARLDINNDGVVDHPTKNYFNKSDWNYYGPDGRPVWKFDGTKVIPVR